MDDPHRSVLQNIMAHNNWTIKHSPTSKSHPCKDKILNFLNSLLDLLKEERSGEK
jgi:hypothetical protein